MMHGYRLTSRGKIVVTLFFLAVALYAVNVSGKIGIAMASDNSGTYALNSSGSTKHAEIMDEEINIGAECITDLTVKENEDFLSIKAEDIDGCGKKVAFLTFDDGPSKNITPLILEILDKYNVKATFFVLGSLCSDNSLILKEVEEKGHSIGIHSYSHDYKKVFKDKESFKKEIEMTEKTLKSILGENFSTRLFRFPGGCFEEYKLKFRDYLAGYGYTSVDWNSVTGDGESLYPKPERLMKRLKETSDGKDKLIVLMHDSASKEAAVKVLPDVIEYLKSQGYEFAILK